MGQVVCAHLFCKGDVRSEDAFWGPVGQGDFTHRLRKGAGGGSYCIPLIPGKQLVE